MEENVHLETETRDKRRRKGRETRTDGVNKTQMKGWRGYGEKKGGQEKREVEKNVN